MACNFSSAEEIDLRALADAGKLAVLADSHGAGLQNNLRYYITSLRPPFIYTSSSFAQEGDHWVKDSGEVKYNKYRIRREETEDHMKQHWKEVEYIIYAAGSNNQNYLLPSWISVSDRGVTNFEELRPEDKCNFQLNSADKYFTPATSKMLKCQHKQLIRKYLDSIFQYLRNSVPKLKGISFCSLLERDNHSLMHLGLLYSYLNAKFREQIAVINGEHHNSGEEFRWRTVNLSSAFYLPDSQPWEGSRNDFVHRGPQNYRKIAKIISSPEEHKLSIFRARSNIRKQRSESGPINQSSESESSNQRSESELRVARTISYYGTSTPESRRARGISFHGITSESQTRKESQN